MQIPLCNKIIKCFISLYFYCFVHPPLCLCLMSYGTSLDSIHLLSECCTTTDLTEGRCKKRPQWRLLGFATSSQLADCRYPLTSNKCPSLLPLSANVCKTWERKICHFCRLSLYCYWVEIENAIADDKWQRETQTSPQIRERHRTGRYWVGVKLNLYKNLIIEHCYEVQWNLGSLSTRMWTNEGSSCRLKQACLLKRLVSSQTDPYFSDLVLICTSVNVTLNENPFAGANFPCFSFVQKQKITRHRCKSEG